MKPLWLLVVAGTLAALSCTPYIMKDNIPGPHGEPLVEIACASPDECMTFARETCHGDFEVATNSYNPPRQIDISSAADIMLVHCQNAPSSPPAALHVAAPDAGP